MSIRLHSETWPSIMAAALQEAALEIGRMDADALDGSSLEALIARIEDRYLPKDAMLDVSHIAGVRRTIEILADDENGPVGAILDRVLEVTIPFIGDPKALTVAPIAGDRFGSDCAIERDTVILRIPDDAEAQARVRAFVAKISSNLAALRAETTQFKSFLRTSTERAVTRKKPAHTLGADVLLDFPIHD